MGKIDSKKELLEILDYYKYRVQNGCTMAEIDSALEALENNMGIDGTISDFAKFYGVSESNVRATISRKLINKPKRKVLYPFHAFRKVIPESWKKGRE